MSDPKPAVASAAPPLTEGQEAPDFRLPCDGGGTITLADFAGQQVVIVAYGQDGTPTCTGELREFQALAPQFRALGVALVGLSKDSVKAHDRFKAREGFEMILASDAGGHLMQDWGLYGQKLFFGKIVQGVLRKTIWIRGGRIAKVWPVDRVKGHAAEVLAAVRQG